MADCIVSFVIPSSVAMIPGTADCWLPFLILPLGCKLGPNVLLLFFLKAGLYGF
jgi:hypothetical protein